METMADGMVKEQLLSFFDLVYLGTGISKCKFVFLVVIYKFLSLITPEQAKHYVTDVVLDAAVNKLVKELGDACTQPDKLARVSFMLDHIKVVTEYCVCILYYLHFKICLISLQILHLEVPVSLKESFIASFCSALTSTSTD
jgi:hypothetical protein